jgi:TonB family protein
MMPTPRLSLVARFAVVGLLAAGPVAAQDSLAGAQALYANAQYEEALASLDRLRAVGLTPRDVPPVEQYRALCLLALGRAADAEAAIAAVITAMPSYAPPDRDVSPRVRSAFHDVRRRVVPVVLQQRYGEAKAAFERQDFTTARDGFSQVVAVLADPGLSDLANQPPLADLTLLAKGFHDLSVTSLAPANTPPASAPPSLASSSVTTGGTTVDDVAERAPAATPAASTPDPAREARETAAAASTIYTSADPGVVGPVIVRQALPPYPRRPLMPQQGIVEVVIDERGAVESATMRESVDTIYDTLATAAARSWQYKPATRNGVPVKFRKGVQIRIQP